MKQITKTIMYISVATEILKPRKTQKETLIKALFQGLQKVHFHLFDHLSQNKTIGYFRVYTYIIFSTNWNEK